MEIGKDYVKPIAIGALSILAAVAVIEVYKWWKKKQAAKKAAAAAAAANTATNTSADLTDADEVEAKVRS